MTSHCCRVAAFLFLFVTPLAVSHAQAAPRLDAGASAGGSVFGWQPQVGLAAESPAASLGWAAITAHASFARIEGTSAFRSSLLAGAQLSITREHGGWWMAGEVVRRSGLADVVEQPRISTGGWRRIGPLTIGIAASRRSARLSDTKYFTRDVVTYFSHLDSVSGQWDTVSRVATVADSARTSGGRLWAETEGSLLWEASRWSARLTAGGRLATRNVPGGAWAGAELAVRLTPPLSLVFGGSAASISRFAFDAEHRYVTLGFRIRPASASSASTRTVDDMPGIGPLGVDSIGVARYRLSLWVPRAHSVELSGDFTGWKPLPLVRAAAGEWSTLVVLLPGAHRINARIDGGAWFVPPGLTSISDDFAGTVGILVIEGGSNSRK